ncbi:MAG: hypothetical protein IKY33_03220 [Clostridia bacterium]|nr:hypothetical protein [Clostridia bacterium]
MIYPIRRSYATPTSYVLGGQPTEGIDTSGRGDLPPSRAAMALNLRRTTDGSLCKRLGFYLKERRDIDGKVIWAKTYKNKEYLFYIGPQGGRLRRYAANAWQERAADNAHFVEIGDKAIIFTPSGWIVPGDKTLMIVQKGFIDLSVDWTNLAYDMHLDCTDVTVPLIRAGTSTTGKGGRVLPPNLLTPLVQESFVYTDSDRSAQRNRLCLAEKPVLFGELPVEGDGTHNELTDAQKATRIATLKATCRVEVRVEENDAYGNSASRWKKRSWSHLDNISVSDGALWLSGIHNTKLAMDGDDNIRVLYCRDISSRQTKKLLAADAFSLFGVGGVRDRLFAASGNRIYYSGLDDPLYFGELQYVDVSADVKLLAAGESTLFALTDKGAHQITGRVESEVGEYALDAAFAVSACLPSPIPAGRDTVIAGGELLFYSRDGLCAVTPSGVLDERCIQLRSKRLQGFLQTEKPEDIRLWAQGDWLFVVGKYVYLFDLQRRVRVEDEVNSTHGYEGYLWSGLNADCFVAENEFYREGNLYALHTGEDNSHYHDEYLSGDRLVSQPISSLWQTVNIGNPAQCGCFYGLILQGQDTAIRVSFLDERGVWRMLYDYDGSMTSFAYSYWKYAQFCYHCTSPAALRRRLPLHHRRSIALRFENDVYDQPLRLQTFLLEYK